MIHNGDKTIKKIYGNFDLSSRSVIVYGVLVLLLFVCTVWLQSPGVPEKIPEAPLPNLHELESSAPVWRRGSGRGRKMAEGEQHNRFLRRLRDLGLSPSFILDAGANHGHWSRAAWAAFGGDNMANPPTMLLFEGAGGCASYLQTTGFDFVIAVLGANTQQIEYFSDGSSTGNSVFREKTNVFVDVKPTRRVMHTIDDLVELWLNNADAKFKRESHEKLLPGPVVFKLDVQGYEIEVLRGATKVLDSVDVLLLETSIVPWNQGAPLAAALISYVGSLGFEILDLIETHSTNGVLIQLDFGFVRTNSLYMNLTAQTAGLNI
jgi:FkbM family methyltransferase